MFLYQPNVFYALVKLFIRQLNAHRRSGWLVALANFGKAPIHTPKDRRYFSESRVEGRSFTSGIHVDPDAGTQ